MTSPFAASPAPEPVDAGRSASDTMTCARCGETKHRRDGFPTMTYAICWRCSWDRHMEETHPLPRSVRRKIRRAAQRAARSELVRQAKSELSAAKLALDHVRDEWADAPDRSQR